MQSLADGLACAMQVVMLGVRSLADITDERVLPWDYLSALILVFLIMVGVTTFNVDWHAFPPSPGSPLRCISYLTHAWCRHSAPCTL